MLKRRGASAGLFGVIVGDGEQKVPEGGETLEGLGLADPGGVGVLDLGKGRIVSRMEVVVSEFLVDLIVDLVEPMNESVPRREVDRQHLVGVGQTGPTKLAGEDVGQGLEEGGVGGFLVRRVDKGGMMEKAPAGRPPEASVHGSLVRGVNLGVITCWGEVLWWGFWLNLLLFLIPPVLFGRHLYIFYI